MRIFGPRKSLIKGVIINTPADGTFRCAWEATSPIRRLSCTHAGMASNFAPGLVVAVTRVTRPSRGQLIEVTGCEHGHWNLFMRGVSQDSFEYQNICADPFVINLVPLERRGSRRHFKPLLIEIQLRSSKINTPNSQKRAKFYGGAHNFKNSLRN